MPLKEEIVCNDGQWIDFTQPTQGEMEELVQLPWFRILPIQAQFFTMMNFY
jgi:hypothetical protein